MNHTEIDYISKIKSRIKKKFEQKIVFIAMLFFPENLVTFEQNNVFHILIWDWAAVLVILMNSIQGKFS